MSSIRKLRVLDPDPGADERSERRIGAERRRFSYSAYIPERRTRRDRRSETELKKSPEEPMAHDIEE
jgi:hypothetical protein